MMIVVLFRRQSLTASETRWRDVASRAEVASSGRGQLETGQAGFKYPK